jgi:uncharacterized delta-60 repeat protein
MKKLLSLFMGIGLLTATRLPAAAQSLDPSFTPSTILAPGGVTSAIEQPDGKIVAVGNFSRVNGSPAYSISRLNTNGTLDAAFQQNVGAASGAYEIVQLSTGKFLVSEASGQPLTAGGITRQGLLRLNADGSGDASFNVGTGPTGAPAYIDDFLPLPNGQTIVVGAFDEFNGVPANGIVRLTATGAVDPTFNPGLGLVQYDEISTIVPLPNGQFLIGGTFTSYNGNSCNGLARLNADGSFDSSFVAALTTGTYIINVVVQPDGKILLSGDLHFGTTTGQSLARLLPTGALDTGFTTPSLTGFSAYSFSGPALQLQPDGKIVFISTPGTPFPRVARLNTNGTLDTSFNVGTGPNSMPSSVVLLANGNVLVSGSFTDLNGVLNRPLLKLASTGAVDAAFQPLIQTAGSVNAIVRQSDGKVVVGGYFTEINGQVARNLARFNANGTLDATFVTANSLIVVDLALQPDGRILAATSSSVQRLLANGSIDNSLTTPTFTASRLTRILLQPDGRIVVGAASLFINGTSVTPRILRLMPDGSQDNTFTPSNTAPARINSVLSLALQPDGKLLVGEAGSVKRLEPTGLPDASFAASPGGNCLAVQPDGKIIVGGNFQITSGTTTISSLQRLNANGTRDAGFVSPINAGTVYSLFIQPNGRILVAGYFEGTGLPSNLARLLPSGQADASFTTTAMPNNTVRAMLVQPDGAIVLGGIFTSVSSQPIMSLARITAPNVLHVAAPQAVADRTTAWPVPAQANLYVAPDPSAHPQVLDLLDALGRPVLHQAWQGAPTATLPLETLAPGTYLLRVTYTEGTVLRRIQVQ